MSEPSETPFRVYTLDAEGKPECLGAADDVSLGTLLLDLHDGGRILRGVMYRLRDGERGEWLINPWERVKLIPTPSIESGRLRGATKESEEEA